MGGPNTEGPAMAAWRDGYERGFERGWDRGLDRAVTLLRGRVSAEAEQVLVELAGIPEEPAEGRPHPVQQPAPASAPEDAERGPAR